MAKFKTILAAAVAASLLAGCAHPMIWNPPPGGTEAQFHRDNIECMQTARATVGDGFAMGSPMFVAIASAAHQENVRGVFKECMLGKEYSLQK